MRSEKIFDLVVLLFIAAVGLAAAYICFGVLSSQGSGKFEQYSLGGAITGALVSWSFLTTIYLQVRRSGNELDNLRKENRELQGKLIRGAPCPKGFDIEVDERQRIVLARPKDWEPKGGIIFQLELPEEKMKPEDDFAAMFQCSFLPIEKDKESNQTAQKYYERQLEHLEASVKSGYVQSYSKEVARLGGEAASTESLKVIARQYARVKKERDPGTLRVQRSWEVIPSTEYFGWIYDVEPRQIMAGQLHTIKIKGAGFHLGADCHVNKESRTAKLIGPREMEVTLKAEDVAKPGRLEVAIVNPETNGRSSNPVWLEVVEATHDQAAAPQAPNTVAGKQVDHEMEAPEKPKKAPDPAPAHADGKGKKPANAVDGPKAEEPTEAFLEIMSMTVICYEEALDKIFFFEFWDDSRDFLESSDEFNRILASARFLN